MPATIHYDSIAEVEQRHEVVEIKIHPFDKAELIGLAIVYLKDDAAAAALAESLRLRRVIVSDLVTWNGTVTAKDPNLVKAYDTLKIGSDKVKDYLLANGIPESEITLSAITTTRRLHQETVTGASASPGSLLPGW